MAIQNMGIGNVGATQAARIGKLKGEVLAHAIPVEVLGMCGMQKQIPKNQSDTVLFRRWTLSGPGSVDNRWITGANVNTFAGAHLTSEGVTPTADALTATDITATLNQYSCLYSVTDRTVDMYEDDIPSEMKKHTGERIGLVREMVRYGVLKGMTNLFYGGTGNSKATTNGTVSLNLLRKITRSIKANHGKMITSTLAASPNFATTPVEAAYIVFCHSDLEPAIRDLPGFKHVSEYGQRKPVHEMEIGSCESFRFVLSPELAQDINAGASVGATGLQSTGGANIDIYPMIVCGEDAWGQVALRGMDSIDVTYIAPGQKDKNDPLGQRGFIGAKTYFTTVVLNNGWSALAWVGTPSL
jgi:N4-gp56 family major capsid protein